MGKGDREVEVYREVEGNARVGERVERKRRERRMNRRAS